MTFNVTYGYKLENGIVKIDEAESGIVSMIYELYTNSRMNQAKIAKHLNEQNIKTRNGKEWYYSLIHQILKNERYTGKLDYPQIVSKEMFNIAKKMMSQNNTNFIYRAPNHEINVSKTSRYSKIIRCSECGKLMFRRSKNKVNNFWICNNTQCISNCISEKELDKLITDLILTIITAPHIIQMEEKICKLEILKFEDYKIDSTDFLELLNKEIIKVFESIPKKNKSNEILRYINQYGNGEINLEQLMIYLISEINVSLYDGIKIKLINEKIFSYKYKLKECN